MKTTYLIPVFALLLCTACGSGEPGDASARSIPEPDIVERLHVQKKEIEERFRSEPFRVQLYTKTTANGVPKLVTDDFPEEMHTMYEILTDDAGHMICAWEFPMISAGEWNISYIHYFDKSGHTFAFERQCSFLNSRCTPGVAREVRTEFFNGSFQMLDREYELVDAQNKPLQKGDCVFPFNFIYQASSDTGEYLKANKIRR